MKVSSKDRFEAKLKNIIFIGFLIVYGIILLYLSYKINISEDEAYTLNTTSYDLAGVIRQSYHFEGQPPVYFILLSFWRYLYPGIFFAKLFSILFIGLSCYVFYRLVILFSGVECSKWMVVIFLLNPFTVWAGLEMRTYSLLIFLSTTAIYFFFRYYFEDMKKFIFLFLLISAVGVYTQYFFVFLVAALAFIIWIFKGWKAFSGFCLYLIPLVLIFLPNLLFLSNDIELHESNGSSMFSLKRSFNVLYSPQNLMLSTQLLPGVWLNRIVRIVFIFLATYTYLKLYNKSQVQNKFYLLKYNYNIILLSVFVLIVLFSTGIYVTDVGYADKYMAVVFPLFLLFFALFIIYSSSIRSIIFGTLSIYFIILLFFNYRHPVKTYDYISIANYIRKIEHPNEPILIYRPAIALCFNIYYNGKNKIVPLPYPVKFDTSYLINIKDTTELRELIDTIKSSSKSYLLISDTTVYESTVNMNRKMINDYIDYHYIVTLDTLFYGWGKEKPLRIKRFAPTEKN